MTQPKLTVMLACLVLVIALVSIGWRLWPAGSRVNPAPFVGLGQVLADETIKAVPGQGRIVAVINEPFQLSTSPLHDEWEHFQSELKKHSPASLVTEVLPVDLNEMVIGNTCSSAQLRAVLQKFEGADALVFFIGLPEWGKLQSRGPAPLPGATKIIVAMEAVPTKREYGGYFANGYLTVLIGRQYAPVPLVKPQTPREWFDRYYQVITPKIADSLPD